MKSKFLERSIILLLSLIAASKALELSCESILASTSNDQEALEKVKSQIVPEVIIPEE